jgi:hypothetical protein
MRTCVITHNEFPGFHCWTDAPLTHGYLRARHRHNFVVECHFRVEHDNREIEIFNQQEKIMNFIGDKYGIPAEFHEMSCEMIAKEIVNYFPECITCSVREDGFGGAVVSAR